MRGMCLWAGSLVATALILCCLEVQMAKKEKTTFNCTSRFVTYVLIRR
jgi:hypothetical protein